MSSTGGTAPLPPSTRVASSDAITGESHSVIGAKCPPRTIACGLSRLTTVPSATPEPARRSRPARRAPSASPASARRHELARPACPSPRESDRRRRSMPAAASSGSRPGARLQAAARAARARAARRARRSCGRTRRRTRGSRGTARRRARSRRRRRSRPSTYMKSLMPVAAPSHSSASAARLASLSSADRQVGRVDALAQLLDDRDVAPVQVRRDQQRAALRCRPGRAPRPWRRSAAGPAPGPRRSAPRASSPSRSRTSSTLRPRLSAASMRLVARAAGEIGGLDADVVDVDLQPERHHAVARDVDHQARPAGGAAVLGAALHEQPELHQFAHQAGDRALVEPGVGGDRRARARAALDHLAQHDAQVVPPHGALARELDGRLRGPHEVCNRIDGDGHQRSPTGGGDDPRRRRRRWARQGGRRDDLERSSRRSHVYGVVVDSVNVSVLL